MTDSGRESNLIKGIDENEEELLIRDGNNIIDKKKWIKIILVIFLLILIITIILIILFFIVFKEDSNSENNEIYDSPSEIDTIPKEEMDKARNKFKQYKYIDTVNSSYSLEYNLFIPTNYTKEKKYPLIIFIEDASLIGPDKVKNPLEKTVGGPIWATEREQKKHECFVLAPQYNEVIIDDNKGNIFFSEYINVTVRLIENITGSYSINPDKIYSTGQSMGAMTTLYLLANYSNLLAAGLIVDGQWKIEELAGLINASFTYIVAGGDEKAFKGQTEVKEYFNSLNISYGSLTDINAQENVENLNDVTNKMYNLSYNYNFITYKNGSVFPPNAKKTMEHMASFKYGYRIDAIRDWIFEQNKIKCEKGTYYSEDGKCSDTNFCKVTNKDLSCKECVYGYFLTKDRGACTQEPNCENGDNKNGECNYCILNYYIDLQDKKCYDNTNEEKYKLCIIVDKGICKECELSYFLSENNKCTITPNCSISENTLCTKCQEGFHLGLDHRCSSVEKCIYSRAGSCNECEDGYYLDIYNDKCVESKDNFINCKRNSYNSPEVCELCKNDFYISYKDHLCYDNTAPGPFYKCEISNTNGDKCISCIDGYYIGKYDSNCSKIEGCLQSFDENTCIECDDYYCLDNKGNCSDNYYVIDEDIKYYYRCKKLNADGTKCETCERELNATEEGICYDKVHCETFIDGKCCKCQNDNPWGYLGYCLNEEFGCVDTFLEHCIRCDDLMNLDVCTQCEEGYEIDEFGGCIKIE